MSTPLLPPSRFANLRRSLQRYTSQSTMLGYELKNAIGCHSSTSFDDLDNRIAALVFDWQRANWDAHFVRYEHNDEITQEARAKRPDPDLPPGKMLSLIELLKALQALRYNCDRGEASGEAINTSLKVLDLVIDELKDAVISSLLEYEAAEWAI